MKTHEETQFIMVLSTASDPTVFIDKDRRPSEIKRSNPFVRMIF